MENILSKFPSNLRKNIKEILTSQIGLSSSPIKIRPDPKQPHCYVLELPYAGRSLTWEMYFNNENTVFAPDFDFTNDDFLDDPDIDMICKEIPSWEQWDVSNPKSLANLVKDFYELYKKYQIEKLKDNKFILQYSEFTSVLEHDIVADQEIEVYVGGDMVYFLILIPIDCTNISPYNETDNFIQNYKLENSEDHITLLLSYSPKRVNVSLSLSPKLEQIIDNISVSANTKKEGLGEIVTTIRNTVKDKFTEIESQYKMRKEFVSYLLSLQPNSILEYDSTSFYKIALLLQVEKVYATVLIKLEQFPAKKPEVDLSSVSIGHPMKVYSDDIDIAYNSSWTTEKMVHELLQGLFHMIPLLNVKCLQEKR